MEKPLVSVIVPAYNCEKYVGQAIASALGQSEDNLEILVIDDASTDRTASIVAEMAGRDKRVRLLPNAANSGVARSRNRGVARAQGDYIAFLDADDIWEADKLRQQLQALERTSCDLCYTGYSFLDEDGREIRKPYIVPEAVSFRELLRENVIGLSTVLCRTGLLKAHPMREDYAHEDYVLWLELLRDGCRACGIARPLMRYRIVQGSRSDDKRRAAANRWRIYRSFLGMSLPTAGAVFAAYAWRGAKKHLLKQ